MRLIQLFEAPINAMQVDPDFNANNLIQQNTWTGPKEKFRPDYRPVDVKALNDPGVLKRIETRFLKRQYPFNLYFWTSRSHENAENSKEKGNLLLGVVSPNNLPQVMGPDAARRVLGMPGREQSITVVIANNLATDVGFVSLRSPWMVAHRIAHGLLMTLGGNEIAMMFREFLKDTLLGAYHMDGEANPEAMKDFSEHWIINPYVVVLTHVLGTTRAARDGNLNNPGEFMVESLAQFLLLGQVRFNDKLPSELPWNLSSGEDWTYDDAVLTGEISRQQLSKDVKLFEKLINAKFAELLRNAVGKIVVV